MYQNDKSFENKNLQTITKQNYINEEEDSVDIWSQARMSSVGAPRGRPRAGEGGMRTPMATHRAGAVTLETAAEDLHDRETCMAPLNQAAVQGRDRRFYATVCDRGHRVRVYTAVGSKSDSRGWAVALTS